MKFYEYAPGGDYRIISTDYKEHSLVYSCTDFLGLFKIEYVWLLTRQRTLSEEIATLATQVLSQKLPQYALTNLYWTG